MAQRYQATQSLLRSTGIDEIHVSTETEYVDPLVKFFKKREKMLR
jgi:hypothetical protein